MSTDLTFITNEENRNLLERFRVLIKDTRFFDYLVGFITQYLETLPIPSVTNSEKAPIINLVQTILDNPDSSSVPQLEADINHLVYGLYNLTPDEIKQIEGIIK
jgi:hypothetical protein